MTPERLREYHTLREANEARQREWDKGDKITLSYRGNELAGETGEACNVIKKLERERMGIRGSRATVEQLAEELADVVICADLVAMAAGIDMDAAVVAKFNATSEKVGLATRLTARAIAPLIEAARAEGQKDMQERCRQVAASDLFFATFDFTKAWDECRDSEAGAASARNKIAAVIAALPIDGANQIQSSDGGGAPQQPSKLLATETASDKGKATDGRSARRFASAPLSDGSLAHGMPDDTTSGSRPTLPPSEAKQGAEPVAWCVFWNEGNSACRRTFDTETPALSWAAYLDRERCTNVSVEPLGKIGVAPAPDREAVARISDKDMRWLLSATDVGSGRSRLRSLLGGTR